jgi:hypothetical protein
VSLGPLSRARRALLRAAVLPLHARHALAARGLPPTANERRLLALRDRHRGERCVILGGGPSLARTPWGLLRGVASFAVNGFYHLLPQVGFVPTYYVVEDRLVAEDNAVELRRLGGTTRLFPEDLRYCLAGSPETVFLRFDRFYDDPERPSAAFPRFVEPDRLVFYWGGTVSYLNLQLAFYMGFRRVYLLGMDMSYAVPAGLRSNVIVSETADANHVHPDWFGPGKRWHDPRVDRMELAFRRARERFESDGREVWNATPGGNLEVFPRVSLEEALR